MVERYIDLSQYYDRAGLQPLKQSILAATAEYRGRYKRVYRCLGAAGELRRDMNELVDPQGVQKRLGKRAAGIISIAHPDFREELIASAEKMGIWRRSSKR